MPTRALCVTLLACLLSTGCALIEPRVQRVANKLECDGSRDCVVVVTVDCTRYSACDMRVDYDVVVVIGERRPQDIRWELAGDKNVEFTSDGVAFRNSAFDCRADGAKRFACRDLHPDFGVFKYAINVTLKESPFGPRGVQSLDPWVVNR